MSHISRLADRITQGYGFPKGPWDSLFLSSLRQYCHKRLHRLSGRFCRLFRPNYTRKYVYIAYDDTIQIILLYMSTDIFVNVFQEKGVSKRAVKESQKEKMGHYPSDDGNGNALFECQNDCKPQQKQQELLGGFPVSGENTCFAVPA